MSQVATDLIPPPSIVRERLADNLREGRILKDLLRLSIRATVDDRPGRGAEPPRRGAEPPRREAVPC
jgi:hypothetical protein